MDVSWDGNLWIIESCPRVKYGRLQSELNLVFKLKFAFIVRPVSGGCQAGLMGIGYYGSEDDGAMLLADKSISCTDE